MPRNGINFFPFIVSGLLLNVIFPRISLGWLAWFALIPFLRSLRKLKSRAQAIQAGLITGILFHGCSLFWLVHVAWFGWVFVACLQTIFFVLFAVLAYEASKIKKWNYRILWISASWTLCEVLRSNLPIFGFPWNLLAYTQSDYSLIRILANSIGAYGLGFVIVWINASFEQLLRDWWRLSKMKYWHFLSLGRMSLFELRQPLLNVIQLVLVLVFILIYGLSDQSEKVTETGSLRISVVQGNIPQEIKWDLMAREKILEVYMKLSQLAAPDQPHLMIWPEAAFPGYFNMDTYAEQVKEMIKSLKIPFLIGSPHSETPEVAYNSAYFVNDFGHINDRYDKQHLVPFGEYVPLPLIFGWLRPIAYSLGVSDFYEGSTKTVFQHRKTGSRFSTLICFEDIFPDLARQFVEKGARFLVVITNDAWFKNSAAPYQHLQASIFRAIENGVPVIRAANTGISGFIDKKGKVISRVENQEGHDIFVTGTKTETISLDEAHTFYRSLGFYFPYLLVLALVILGIKWKRDPDFAYDPEDEIEE